ncbi:MAG: rhomboid family intramembrane serine protease [Flavobacteriales bacterium]|nr:rhomboid family intramembrane serine protease [Flavobacteriales bacterium]MBL6872762.1 rhomboid family intramembrane serine protease [Flavobacteriales bacterium]
MLSRLIYLNVGVFILLEVLNVFFFLFKVPSYQILNYLGLAASPSALLSKPWSALTYMFIHNGFIHLAFNLLWLYFGGSIFLRYLSNKQIVSTYIIGGLSGGLFYITAYNYFPAFNSSLAESMAVGSSASVLAILVAIATYVPSYSVNLTFIGNVKLKHIAIVSIVLDLILIPKGNAGGHIAHIGGAFYGFIFSRQLLKGKDISRSFDRLMDYLASALKPSTPLKTAYKRPKTDDQWRENKSSEQKQINLILDKIAKSGYDSLNKEEKDTLFKASKK